MESTVEYSIAKESIEVHPITSKFLRDDYSGRVRTTFPMKNPFSKRSTFAMK